MDWLLKKPIHIRWDPLNSLVQAYEVCELTGCLIATQEKAKVQAISSPRKRACELKLKLELFRVVAQLLKKPKFTSPSSVMSF